MFKIIDNKNACVMLIFIREKKDVTIKNLYNSIFMSENTTFKLKIPYTVIVCILYT